MTSPTKLADLARFAAYRSFLKELDLEQRRALRNGYAHIRSRIMALVEEKIARTALRERRAYGKMALQSMWNICKNGWHTLYLGEFETLGEWAEQRLLYDEDGTELATLKHLQSMVRIVERILLPVYQASSSGNPFIRPETGEVITPELLIEEPGIQEKMRLLSYEFANAADLDQKQEVLDKLFTETKASIESTTKERERKTSLFTWWRTEYEQDVVTYILKVPREHTLIVEASLRREGQQTFEEEGWPYKMENSQPEQI